MEFLVFCKIFIKKGYPMKSVQMKPKKVDYVECARNVMLVAQRAFLTSSSSSKKEVGTTNSKGDRSLGMDVAIEKAVICHIQEQHLPVQIYSEEAGVVNGAHQNPKSTFSMDPLDGSVNYKYGKGKLPFGTLVAFFKGLNPVLDDVVAAGVIEYTSGDFFIFDGKKTVDQHGKKVTLSADWKVHKTTPVYLDTFYTEGVKAYTKFTQEVFIRGSGSVVGNLTYTLSNISAAMGGISVRAEEIGAVYGLIKGAGGVIVDHEGIPLGTKLFNPKGEYQLLAGNEHVINFMVRQMAEM